LREDGVAFQAVPDYDLNLEQSTLRHIRWILVVEKEVKILISTHVSCGAEKCRQHSEAW